MSGLTVKAAIDGACPAILRPYWERLEASPLGYRLAKGVFWSVVGAAISRGLMLVASVCVARFLGREEYGELGILRSTVDAFAALAGFGLGVTATKHVAEYRSSDPERAGRMIALSSVVSLMTAGTITLSVSVMASWLSSHTLAMPGLAGPLQVTSLLIFFTAINGAQTGALAGFEAFRCIAMANLATGLLSFPLLVVGTRLARLEGAVWGLVAAAALGCTVNHGMLRWQARRFHVPLRWSGCFRERVVLWSFSLPASLAGLMLGPVNWACAAMLVQQPGGYAEMGLLSAANQWRVLLAFLPSFVMQAFMPVMSTVAGSADRTRTGRALNGVTGMIMLLVIPLGTLLIFAPRHAMAIYGSGFADGQTVFCWTVVSVMIQSLGSAAGVLLQARGRMWIGLAVNAIYSMVLLSFVWLFVGRLGATSIALGSALSYGITTVLVFFALLRDLSPRLLGTVTGGLLLILATIAVAHAIPPHAGDYVALPAWLLSAGILVRLLLGRGFSATAQGVSP